MKKNNKKTRILFLRDTNKLLLILSLIFMFGGAFLILDASSISSVLYYGNDTPYFFFQRQLFFIFLSLVMSVCIMLYPTRLYDKTSKGLVFITLILLIIAFFKKSFFSKGISTATLDLFGGRFQVAEFLKVFLIMYFGAFFGKWVNEKKHNKYIFFFPLVIAFGASFLIALGGDLGTSIIMMSLFGLMFIIVPCREKAVGIVKMLLVAGMIAGFVGIKYAYKILPEDFLMEHPRFSRLIYINPCDRYEEDTGYQVCNGYIAIDNGGVTGSGIGESVQKYLYLPASHTDFIFPIVVEELGVITGVFIIIGYMAIIYFTFMEAVSCTNLRNSIICYGIGIYFMLHIFVNLGGVLGIIPLTGVPLPFLSYGGSFCIVVICSFAIIQRIHIENQLEEE